MNWIRENPFLAGLMVAAVVVLGGLGYLLAGAIGSFGGQEEAYRAQVQQLHKLQNSVPYPNQENLERVRASVQTYKDSLRNLRQRLDSWQPPFPVNVTPQQFQDDLRRIVSQVEAAAAEAEVDLPADFYLGFNEFQTGLPAQAVTPTLARQLGVIEAVVRKMIDARVARVDVLGRVRGGGERVPVAEASQEPIAPADVVKKTVWDLTVSGEQSRVRAAFNSLLDTPQFLVIRTVQFTNSARQGPPRVDPSEPAEDDPFQTFGDATFTEQFTPGGGSGESLPVVLGREQVEMKIRFELLDFADLQLE